MSKNSGSGEVICVSDEGEKDAPVHDYAMLKRPGFSVSGFLPTCTVFREMIQGVQTIIIIAKVRPGS